MNRPVRERDLRSLERRSLYQIFAPLDPDERLPRESLLERRVGDTWSRATVAGFLWPLAYFAVLGLVTWISGRAILALVALVPLFAAFWIYARPRRRSRETRVGR